MATKLYELEQWSLDDLFPGLDSPSLKEAETALETMIQAFEKRRDQLASDLETAEFTSILEEYEVMVRALARIAAFGELRFYEDTQNQNAQAFAAQTEQKAAEFDNRTMFFKLWWKTLEDEAAERLLAEAGDYQYWLEALRLQRPYTLSEAEEKVINLKDVNGTSGLVTLYESIVNRYVFNIEVDGEERELTYGELAVYVRNPDPDLRAAAYKEMYRVYGADAPILGQIYQYRLRDWSSEKVELRGFSAPMSVRNLANDIPDEVVDILLDVCQKNTSIFQRYFQLKARWIGMEKLRRFDIYAPVVQTQKTYEFMDAVELVDRSLANFDPAIAKLAGKVLDEHHLDGEVRTGKLMGAFCATVEPALTPWILMSFQGRLDDVATLAHEMGHAIHALLADGKNALIQQASLPLAETASTFSEMLVVDRLLEEDPDPEVQRDLLFRQMDDAYATIMRQAYFALFERAAHKKVAEGASVDELSQLYLENLEDQFGDSIEMNDEFEHEWVVIPHIYRYPFYVYAYAFGQLLVLSLYQQYKEEGEAFKSRYVDILAAGGSEPPAEILKKAGIDMTSAEFWQGGFDVLKRLLEKLEALEIPVSAA